MIFKTIETGSAGNAFLLDDLMIDCGLSWKKILHAAKKTSWVLLTHEHGDHLCIATLRKIVAIHSVGIVCGQWLKDALVSRGVPDDDIVIVEAGGIYEIGEYTISPIHAPHDVPNFGYRIMKDGWRHLHITDSATLEGITAKNYDSASIECNHHRGRALELIKEADDEGIFTHLKGAINSHLSVEEVIEFCKANRIKKLYPVHIGSSTRDEVISALKAW